MTPVRPDSVLNALTSACGPGFARPATPQESVGGVEARWLVTPGTTEEAASVLRVAAEHRLAVVARGAGTKLDWGATPAAVDVILDTGRLTGVSWHAPGDLVATVGAGTPLRSLQAVLEPAGQRLALDPGSASAGATVGGVLGAGEAGPLRLRFGIGRDLLIGVEFIRADGVVAHAGGRVVKNVAGYDLGKLLCGSFGTLGVITSATFRLHPLPARRAWVCRSVWSPLEVHDLLNDVVMSSVVPTGIEIDLPVAHLPPVARQRGAEAPRGPGMIAVLLEGTHDGVAIRSSIMQKLLGGDASTGDYAPPWWGRYPFGPDDVALKLAVPVQDLHAAIYALRDAAGVPVPIRGSAGVGVVHAALPGTISPDEVTAVLNAVRGALVTRGGSCVVLAAPARIRPKLDLWGPVPGMNIMRRVKEQFDPFRLLSPGRFVGGL